ncbi:MAG: hypothetical protein ACOYXR_12480 [Nitrospirota bacterium]
MKRHLVFGTVLAALVGVSTPSWALDVKWGGDYRLRGFYNNNLTDQEYGRDTENDSAAYYSSRFLLTTAFTEENVSGVTTLIIGQTGGNGNRLLGGGIDAGDPSGVYGPEAGSTVGFLEAYIKADFGGWGFAGGRKVYKLGHGIVLDDAVDGLWFDARLGETDVTFGALKLIEHTNDPLIGIGNTTTGRGTGGDTDFYVVNAAFGKMFGGMHTDVFLGYLSDREAALFGGGGVGASGDDATMWVLGAMDGRVVGPAHLHGEIDFFHGKASVGGVDDDLKGLNLTVGAKLDGAVPLGVDLIYTSGQDASSTDERNVNGLNGNYPIGIIITNTGARSLDTKDGTCLSLGGPSTSLGGSNGCIDGAGLTAVKLSSGMTHGPHVIDVALIWARSTEDPDGSGAGNPAGEDIGVELDATLTWALTKKLSLLAGLGYLRAGDFFEDGTNDDPDAATVGVLQVSYTF